MNSGTRGEAVARQYFSVATNKQETRGTVGRNITRFSNFLPISMCRDVYEVNNERLYEKRSNQRR
jgi:hypothetical protein